MSFNRLSALCLLTLAVAATACTSGTPASTAGGAETTATVHRPPHVSTPTPKGLQVVSRTPEPFQTPVPTPAPTAPPVSPQPSPTAVPSPSPSPTASPSPTPVPTPPLPQGVHTLAGVDPAATPAVNFADGDGAKAAFNEPSGLALLPDGQVLVADALNHRLRRVAFAASGKVTVATLAGTGIPGTTDGVGDSAQFTAPRGVAVDPTDPSHPIYVADTANHLIRKVTIDNAGNVKVSTVAGTGTAGLTNGSGTQAQFKTPYGIAVDPVAKPTALYVADTGNHVIRKLVVAADGSVTVSTFVGSGKAEYHEGLGALAAFNAPKGLAPDGAGNIYVADTGNHCLRVITSDGQTRTLAGNGTAGFGEGAGMAAILNSPWGLALDTSTPGAPLVYLIDGANHRVARVTADGSVTTVAGSGNGGDHDGTGTAATFLSPAGLALQLRAGLAPKLFVGDLGNKQIRSVE